MTETAEDLQNALNEFYVYCSQWKLQVNTDKTKILIFSKGPLPKNVFYYNKVAIENVKEILIPGYNLFQNRIIC